MSDIKGGDEDQSYTDCSVASVDGNNSLRSLSLSAESVASCSLDSSDHEEFDRAGEPTPAARPESLPPVAINLVSDDEEHEEHDGGDEALQEPPMAALSPKRAAHVPRLTDLPPANTQRSRKKTASHRSEPMPKAAGLELPPPVAISLVVSNYDSDEQQPRDHGEEAPRQPPVAALLSKEGSPSAASYRSPTKAEKVQEENCMSSLSTRARSSKAGTTAAVMRSIPHADDQQHGDDRAEETP